MAITIEQTLLNNQSILEKITLVEEIDEKAAEIISGGQSGNLLNKEISALDSQNNEPLPVTNPVTNPVITPGTGPGSEPDGEASPKPYGSLIQQTNLAFGQNRINSNWYY